MENADVKRKNSRSFRKRSSMSVYESPRAKVIYFDPKELDNLLQSGENLPSD